MAKPTFAKFGLKVDQSVKKVVFNEQEFEVKQYLPIGNKLDLISNIVNNSIDDNNFANPARIEIYTVIEIVKGYTNISFTEKQLEDVFKLYDLIVSSGLGKLIRENMCSDEFDFITVTVDATIAEIYEYKNSVMGILEAISADYSNLNLDASEIQSKLADPNNMALLKDVLTKLG
jgi:hypothetical protein